MRSLTAPHPRIRSRLNHEAHAGHRCAGAASDKREVALNVGRICGRGGVGLLHRKRGAVVRRADREDLLGAGGTGDLQRVRRRPTGDKHGLQRRHGGVGRRRVRIKGVDLARSRELENAEIARLQRSHGDRRLLADLVGRLVCGQKQRERLVGRNRDMGGSRLGRRRGGCRGSNRRGPGASADVEDGAGAAGLADTSGLGAAVEDVVTTVGEATGAVGAVTSAEGVDAGAVVAAADASEAEGAGAGVAGAAAAVGDDAGAVGAETVAAASTVADGVGAGAAGGVKTAAGVAGAGVAEAAATVGDAAGAAGAAEAGAATAAAGAVGAEAAAAVGAAAEAIGVGADGASRAPPRQSESPRGQQGSTQAPQARPPLTATATTLRQAPALRARRPLTAKPRAQPRREEALWAPRSAPSTVGRG